ncbi:hypothetical protein JTB14_029641 [Gonioctena quinquepunctata]|nr:hypothetical protein JTB14_029641 [Gonioctena quinquepunctata]
MKESLEGLDTTKDVVLVREDQLKGISEHMQQHRERDKHFKFLEQPKIINFGDKEELADIDINNEHIQRSQQAMNIDSYSILSQSMKEKLSDETQQDII